jgi:hypothetical protein
MRDSALTWRRIPLTAQDWKRSLRGLRAPFDSVTAVFRPMRKPRYLLGLLVSLPLFVLSALIWYLVARIVTYGFFWDGGDSNGSWGGPTLAGAWAVHALIALGMIVVAMWLLVPLTRLHAQLNSAHG